MEMTERERESERERERVRERERERLVYSTAPCDRPISILQSHDRSNTLNPALPELET